MSAKRTTGRAGDSVQTDLVDATRVPRATPALEYVGLRPTPYQQRMKSRFWALVRDDPLVDPPAMSGTDVAHLLSEPAVATWWRDEEFRQWFLNGEQWRQSLEWLHDLWVEKAFDLLVHPLLEPKDFIALGRELAKATGRSGPAAGGEGNAPALTPEQARAAIERAAKQLGWLPPPVVSPKEP